MADNIRLVTFAGSTVTPQDDALVYETAINQNGIISGGAITLKNNNTLHIAAGHGIICGRKFTIVESDITVLLTTGDTHFGRAYIHLDLSNTTDPIQILTETGSALSAPIQQPDVNISNGIYEIDLVTFTIDALTISDLVDLRPTVEKIMDIINELKNGLDNAKVDTLTTMEQVNASTDKSKPVGAGAVQEVYNSLVNENSESFNFGVLNGVRGFFTNPSRADDSFIPFKSAFELLLSETASNQDYITVTVPNGAKEGMLVSVCSAGTHFTALHKITGDGIVNSEVLFENIIRLSNGVTTAVIVLKCTFSEGQTIKSGCDDTANDLHSHFVFIFG